MGWFQVYLRNAELFRRRFFGRVGLPILNGCFITITSQLLILISQHPRHKPMSQAKVKLSYYVDNSPVGLYHVLNIPFLGKGFAAKQFCVASHTWGCCAALDTLLRAIPCNPRVPYIEVTDPMAGRGPDSLELPWVLHPPWRECVERAHTCRDCGVKHMCCTTSGWEIGSGGGYLPQLLVN